MLVEQVFKVYLNTDLQTYDVIDGEEITDGILSVDIVHGFDKFEGPWQQIDAGQFTIVSRNPSLDPKINTNLKYNSMISFIDERSPFYNGEFFRGYVTNINVEYIRDDNPIITITGTDIFGVLARYVITQSTYDAIAALSTGPTWNGLYFHELVDYISDFAPAYTTGGLNSIERAGYIFDSFTYPIPNSSLGSEPYRYQAFSPAKYIPAVGENYLDIFNKYVQTNLSTYSYDYLGEFDYQYFTVYPFFKYRPKYWAQQIDPTIKYNYLFSSDPADNKPYESIVVDNGYNAIYNQLNISNEYRYIEDGELKSVQDNYVYLSDASVQNNQNSQLTVNTIFAPNSMLPGFTSPVPLTSLTSFYQRDVFQITASPSYEIKEITFNNARYEDIQNNFSYNRRLYDTFRIKHQINETTIIDKVYDIVGIKHSITPDRWTTTWTTKKANEQFIYEYQGEAPTLELNALTGDTNFNFTASIVGYEPSEVSQIFWALNSTEPNEIQLNYKTAVSGERFKDGQLRSGDTQTWNFDDDGILAPYSFDSINIPPVDNRYGNYGPGNYSVYAYIRLQNRYWLVLEQPIVVGTPAVEADFGWVQNLTNNFGQVSFTNTSVNHETGEPDSYLWNFGDGTTSTEQNPSHVYDPAPGQTTYNVSLTVFAYGPGGTKVYDTKTETITLVQPAMTADFTSALSYQTVTFTNTSTNVGFEEPDAYLWDFGDGTTSTLKNPIKTYAIDASTTQTFSVTLTVRNIWEQTATVTKNVTVTALNDTGTFPVRYIRFRIEPYTPYVGKKTPSIGNSTDSQYCVTPVIKYAKATTSFTNTNRIFNDPILDYQPWNNYPRFIFRTSGGTDWKEFPDNIGRYYITRDPLGLPTSTYGGSAYRRYYDSTFYSPTYWEIVIDNQIEQYDIKNISAIFQDLQNDAGVFWPGFVIRDFYPRVWVDVANTLGSLNNLPAGTEGTKIRNANWHTVGYFTHDGGRMDPTKPAGQITEKTKTMIPIRPMPPRIPYFNYTFNEKIVNFTSVETADSYAWTFGDGTTSTLKDPVKTYAAYGTYNVTLEVTNGGIVTRTTTEPVIVEQRKLNSFPFRYVKFVQNTDSATHAWDTPSLRLFVPEYQAYTLSQQLPPSGANTTRIGLMTNTTEQYNVEFYKGIGTTGTFDPNTGATADRQSLTTSAGMRIKSLEPDFTSGWTTIIDYGSAINAVTNFRLDAGSFSATGQVSPTIASGVSYSIYITDYVGSSIDPNAVTWTQVGTITPGTLTLNTYKTCKLDGVPSLPG